MMRNRLSTAAEDCLLLVHRLEERGEAVTTSGLARSLGVADSTTTAMLQRLSRKRLLKYKARKIIALSAQGQEVAVRLIRRHRLIETYLARHLDYSLPELHAEAESLEHAVSDRFIEAISRKLGNPTIDPHGEPIPDEHGVQIVRPMNSLAEAPAGARGRVARLLDTRPETLRHLSDLGLSIGASVEVLDAPRADRVVHLRVGNTERVLGSELASGILLEDMAE